MNVEWQVDADWEPPQPPEGGWKEPKPGCSWETHRWALSIEDGRASIQCSDPCEGPFDPEKPIPACSPHLDMPMAEDIYIEDLPVRVHYVDDSTPSTPVGPAEYGYYFEIEVDVDALASDNKHQPQEGTNA